MSRVLGATVVAAGLFLAAASPVSASNAHAPESVPNWAIREDGTVRLIIHPASGREPTVDGSLARAGVRVLDVAVDAAASERVALERRPDIASVEYDRIFRASIIPNDPKWPDQDNMDRIGFPTAWDVSQGASNVVVAVLDSGVHLDPDPHPDLAGRILAGRDFVDGDTHPHDEMITKHGTRVSLVALAAGNNGVAWAGACWHCRLLPIRVLDATGSGTATDIAEGIDFAVAGGADVINLSLAGCESADVMEDAIDKALAAGVLVVAAAGNDAIQVGCALTTPRYPAAQAGVIGVAATADESDARASYSGYGTWVDVAAPGTNLEDGTTAFVGTSSATPVVSGLLGIGLAVPGATPAQVLAQMYQTSASVNYVVEGRVDAAAMMLESAVGIPVTGDWNGDGVTTGGWFVHGAWVLLGAHNSAPPTHTFSFGSGNAVPVVGDWNGDGVDDIGVRDGQTWQLRTSLSSGPPTHVFAFGIASDVPVVGDWDGDGRDEPGLRRGNSFRLKHDLGGGRADVQFTFGWDTDTPIAGDFDGNGIDDVGVVRDNAWRLKFSFTGGTADVKFAYARPNEGDVPVTGDWDGDGDDTVGVTRGDSWRLKNVHAGGTADLLYINGP